MKNTNFEYLLQITQICMFSLYHYSFIFVFPEYFHFIRNRHKMLLLKTPYLNVIIISSFPVIISQHSVFKAHPWHENHSFLQHMSWCFFLNIIFDILCIDISNVIPFLHSSYFYEDDPTPTHALPPKHLGTFKASQEQGLFLLLILDSAIVCYVAGDMGPSMHVHWLVV